MNEKIVLLSAILLPILWLVSEFGSKQWLRILLGIISAILIALTISQIRLIIPRETEHFHHYSILMANDLLKKGKTESVISAFGRYASDTTNGGSCYAPAMKLISTLSKEEDQNTSNKVQQDTR